jgi:hypothetical protein
MSDYQPIGTPEAHYAPARYGPFECRNCVHFKSGTNSSEGTCNHPDVQADGRRGYIKTNAKGLPIVEALGCCNYFKP